MNIIQIAAASVIGTALAVQFRGGKSEYSVYISIGISMFIFFCVAEKLRVVLEMIRRIDSYMNGSMPYVPTLVKMLGVAYVSEFASGICLDAGHGTIAAQIEMFGKLTITALGVPVVLALLETIHRFLT